MAGEVSDPMFSRFTRQGSVATFVQGTSLLLHNICGNSIGIDFIGVGDTTLIGLAFKFH